MTKQIQASDIQEIRVELQELSSSLSTYIGLYRNVLRSSQRRALRGQVSEINTLVALLAAAQATATLVDTDQTSAKNRIIEAIDDLEDALARLQSFNDLINALAGLINIGTAIMGVITGGSPIAAISTILGNVDNITQTLN